MEWYDWPLERVIILAMGILHLVIFLQVTLFHYRQNFRHWSMWIPVIYTPIAGICLLILTYYTADWWITVLTVLLVIGSIAGLFGTFKHIRGVGQRVDGYELRNFLIGPPLTLPALITAVGIITLIAMYWE